MARVGFVGLLSVGPVSADVASMEEVESNGVLVLGDGGWTATRLGVLEPIGKGFTDVRG
jgi:hypothetical protein